MFVCSEMAREFNEERLTDLLRCVVALLPVQNSDTLLVLLKFLREVADRAEDHVMDGGYVVGGVYLRILFSCTGCQFSNYLNLFAYISA